MGSTSFLGKSKNSGFRFKGPGSTAGSDKEMNGKLRRTKIRRPGKMTEYGMKRIPDYTELAYKEAVSKLRYFLPGNYSPSIRSYGGSASIKNLDESDGDIDKKYPTVYPSAISEFKPRPRLTAKYATLYADSLKNFKGSTNVPLSTPAPEPPSSNPDVIHFIQKQEEYIEQLERESQYCRDELNNLLGKVKEVISENENLHEAQKNRLISKMFHSYNAGSETDDLDDSTGLDSDHKQSSPSKLRKSKPRARLEGPNIVFESRIAELEAQLTQAKIDLKKIQDENNENKRKLASGIVDSTCLDGFKRQIDNLQRDKSSLESQISRLKLSLEQRDGDTADRYKRGSDVIEQQLREERNNLEAELRRMKEELSQERGKVRQLSKEQARRYAEHCDSLQHDLSAQYDTVDKLQMEMERQRREENELKREISMKNAAIDELKMELKNKMASLQADIAQAHAEKASIEEELANARLTIERQQRQTKHETNRLNSEIQSLRQRLDRADADLVHSRRENLRLTEQIATLEKELKMKHLTPISPEKEKKELNSMLETMENRHANTVAELETMIQSQNSLMEKLTGECRLLTDKLDDSNRRHKQELATLHRQVELLGQAVQQPSTPEMHYQAPPSHLPQSYGNIEPAVATARPPHPGADPTGVARLSRKSSIADIGLNRRNSNPPSRPLSRQSSKSSLRQELQIQDRVEVPLQSYDEAQEEIDVKDNSGTQQVENTGHNNIPNEYEQNNDNQYVEQTNYDPNYGQAYVENSDYQNQGYDQNYDQTAYQGEYPQNLENYVPQQQYATDANNYQEPYNYDATGQNQNIANPVYNAENSDYYTNQSYVADNDGYNTNVPEDQNYKTDENINDTVNNVQREKQDLDKDIVTPSVNTPSPIAVKDQTVKSEYQDPKRNNSPLEKKKVNQR